MFMGRSKFFQFQLLRNGVENELRGNWWDDEGKRLVLAVVIAVLIFRFVTEADGDDEGESLQTQLIAGDG